MSWVDGLIVLGCLGVGYWIVSSVMGPGVDITSAAKDANAPKDNPASQDRSAPPAPTAPGSPASPKLPPMHDWYLVLDIPADAGKRDIQAAAKRRLAQALAAGDNFGVERVRRAEATGLAQVR